MLFSYTLQGICNCVHAQTSVFSLSRSSSGGIRVGRSLTNIRVGNVIFAFPLMEFQFIPWMLVESTIPCRGMAAYRTLYRSKTHPEHRKPGSCYHPQSTYRDANFQKLNSVRWVMWWYNSHYCKTLQIFTRLETWVSLYSMRISPTTRKSVDASAMTRWSHARWRFWCVQSARALI